MPEHQYKCECGHLWPYTDPAPKHCPSCQREPPFTVLAGLEPATVSFSASLKPRLEQVLDAQRLTVLGLLLTLGLTVGFGVGGWWGVGAGIVTPVAVSLAFRNRHTRRWLAKLVDMATGERR
jgi:hypothetical protein